MRRSLSFVLASIAASVAASAISAGCDLRGKSSCGDNPPDKAVTVTADVACQIASGGPGTLGIGFGGTACAQTCGPPYGICNLPPDYYAAFEGANPDASAPDASDMDADMDADNDGGDAAIADAGAIDAGAIARDASAPPRCPAVTKPVVVTCGVFCEGRLTAGIARPRRSSAGPVGDYFARCAYLEAASVEAFRRLRDELTAHGAPRALRTGAERARLDEVRHAERTSALALRFGARSRRPRAVAPSSPRPLFAIALENAVEGCVRETFGAALAHHRALTAGDAVARRTARGLAKDEGRHAELSVRVLGWTWPRLTPRERRRVVVAMDRAWRALAAEVAQPIHPAIQLTAGMPDAPHARAMLTLVRAAVEARIATPEGC